MNSNTIRRINKNMKIIGLRIEKYIDKAVSGANTDFKYGNAEFKKHIICGILSDSRKVEIELSYSVGECGSGWTIATWGHIKVSEVIKFNGYTFIPKEELIIEDIEPGFKSDVTNNVFSVSYNGEDVWYPSGGYHVNMELFEETIRHKNLRPVWIFKGKSNAGKSFLASKLNNLNVYETDSNETLPESIVASVIVLGNKHNFTLEDIKSKIFGEAEIQIVDFV